MTAVFPGRDARAVPGPTGEAQPLPAPGRPALRVVDASYRSAASRRARARLLALLVVAVAVAALFGLVASHVALTQGQFRLEAVRHRAEAAQATYERLRLQVAELESPGRIVAAAQERLGMVPPPDITYLSPVGPVSDAGDDDADPAQLSTEDWSSVKRQLASRP